MTWASLKVKQCIQLFLNSLSFQRKSSLWLYPGKPSESLKLRYVSDEWSKCIQLFLWLEVILKVNHRFKVLRVHRLQVFLLTRDSQVAPGATRTFDAWHKQVWVRPTVPSDTKLYTFCVHVYMCPCVHVYYTHCVVYQHAQHASTHSVHTHHRTGATRTNEAWQKQLWVRSK